MVCYILHTHSRHVTEYNAMTDIISVFIVCNKNLFYFISACSFMAEDFFKVMYILINVKFINIYLYLTKNQITRI